MKLLGLLSRCRLLLCVAAAALVCLPPGDAAAQARRSVWIEYASPATALSAQIRAEAVYLRAWGETQVNLAEARRIRAQAVRQEIANSVQRVHAYWERRAIGEAEHFKRAYHHLDSRRLINSKTWERLRDHPDLNGPAVDNGNALNFLLHRLSGTLLAYLVITALMLGALGALYVALEAGGVAAFAEGDEGDETDELVTEDEGEELAAAPIVPLSVTHDVFLSRDPFDPVVPEPVEAAADPGTSDDTSGATPIGDGSGDGSGDGGDGGSNDDSSVCNPGPELVCEGRVVSLVGITSVDGVEQAVLQVDGTTYQVPEGEVFAEVFQLRTIDGECVTVLYGDEAFSLCDGERLFK
jgi:hypothetical protein